jgi:myo-inositol-1(or 4)-monophosphatase
MASRARKRNSLEAPETNGTLESPWRSASASSARAAASAMPGAPNRGQAVHGGRCGQVITLELVAVTMRGMNDASLAALVEFAADAAAEAGREILKYFRGSMEVANKAAPGAFDPVTQADRSAEESIRSRIRERFPEHGILGEEGGHEGADRALSWIIDPIDGTRAFVLGQLHWGTLLGLCDNGVPCVGVMHQPYVGETFIGSRLGAELRSARGVRTLRARRGGRLAESIVCATDPTMFARPEERAAFERVSRIARAVRWGGDCYTSCLVAAGYSNLVIEAQMKPWDILPLVPIIEAAGGVVSDWSGAPAGSTSQVIVASDHALHREALDALGG